MNQKWYKTKLGIFAILIFPPLWIYLMWKYMPWSKETKWKVTIGIIAVGILGNLLISLQESRNTRTIQPSPISIASQPVATTIPSPTQQPITATNTPVAKEELRYQIIEKNDNKTVENYKVLVISTDDAKNTAFAVKAKCSKACNIDIFDNEKALKLQSDYDKMMGSLDTSPQDLQSWKTKNYVFVADHLVGSLTFDTEDYSEYPLKDWYYKELKSK